MIDLGRPMERWRRLDVAWRDLPLAVALACLVPVIQDNGTQLGNIADRDVDALMVLAVVLQCFPLAVRRRLPTVCLTLVSLGFAMDQLRGYHTAAGTALPIALLSAGAHLERHRRVVVAAACVLYVPLAIALDHLGPGEGFAEYASFFVIAALAWGAGAWQRQTRLDEAARRERLEVSTRAAERNRIARELHDVVTHHVTAMVVQAEAARYVTASADRLDDTLTAITDTGRRAISDLRELLDLLDPEHVPARSPMGDLSTLVEQTRRAGLQIELVEAGTPDGGGTAADGAAYRVVQEALTNALKHGNGGRAVVRVQYGASEVCVDVVSEGPGSGPAPPRGSGRGLAGLRERVDVLGGDFDAGPRADGQFSVHARIPTRSPS